LHPIEEISKFVASGKKFIFRAYKKINCIYRMLRCLIGLRCESVGILSYFKLSQRNQITYIGV